MQNLDPEQVIRDLVKRGHILVTCNGQGWAVDVIALPLKPHLVELWQRMGVQGKLPKPEVKQAILVK